MKTVDYQKMVREIDTLVESDFACEMNGKTLPKSKKYTQEEALQMAKLIGEIYWVAHCIDCWACQSRYWIKEK